MGAWIETAMLNAAERMSKVAPRVGAWIETKRKPKAITTLLWVAPRVGAWIETTRQRLPVQKNIVAPRVGAWIETTEPHTTPY